MLTIDTLARVPNSEPGYARTALLANAVGAAMTAGRVYTTTEVARAVCPGIADPASECYAHRAELFKWLATVARYHPQLVLGTRREYGAGPMRRKLVTKTLWGHARSPVDETVRGGL